MKLLITIALLLALPARAALMDADVARIPMAAVRKPKVL